MDKGVVVVCGVGRVSLVADAYQVSQVASWTIQTVSYVGGPVFALRVGESRADQDHALVVVSVEHCLKPSKKVPGPFFTVSYRGWVWRG